HAFFDRLVFRASALFAIRMSARFVFRVSALAALGLALATHAVPAQPASSALADAFLRVCGSADASAIRAFVVAHVTAVAGGPSVSDIADTRVQQCAMAGGFDPAGAALATDDALTIPLRARDFAEWTTLTLKPGADADHAALLRF